RLHLALSRTLSPSVRQVESICRSQSSEPTRTHLHSAGPVYYHTFVTPTPRLKNTDPSPLAPASTCHTPHLKPSQAVPHACCADLA
ncbi:hypothetical protein COCCADRAFT_88334, partial [Bipolaris zeicola 26-R-13]